MKKKQNIVERKKKYLFFCFVTLYNFQLALELGQAEDFSLCIEEEGTGKRLYIEPGVCSFY